MTQTKQFTLEIQVRKYMDDAYEVRVRIQGVKEWERWVMSDPHVKISEQLWHFSGMDMTAEVRAELQAMGIMDRDDGLRLRLRD